MEKLVEKGLEIRFCHDIKSYKKLIPALSEFPDDFIITADDDVFYHYDWFKILMLYHKKNPGKIICHRAHGITVDKNHNVLPYLRWDKCINPDQYFDQNSVFPVGIGGIFYPAKCFHKEVLNEDRFTKLAPFADDIWFWAMAVINKEYFGGGSPHIVAADSCTRDLWYVNAIEQIRGGALWDYNRSQGGNDKQLKAVMEHYPQIKERLRKLAP